MSYKVEEATLLTMDTLSKELTTTKLMIEKLMEYGMPYHTLNGRPRFNFDDVMKWLKA